ncbi:MAG TPA: TIGR01906 family membrane protein [Anaerolineales bacterium]|nr:TIGR01906 family membrane protein [Anaerolineales bacterium]
MPGQPTKILKLLIMLLIPILIIGGVVRMLATDTYLAFEYGRVSFPADSFGFTDRQRFILASTNIHYVRAHLPGDELSKQTLNGVSVYNPREVSHMADVQAVFQSVFRVGQVSLFLLLLLGFILWRNGGSVTVASAVKSGGILTSGIVLSIALLAIFSWQFWFDNFHRIFFKPGSWLFSYSDTLIRLFPVEFWIDATLTISSFSFVGGLLFVLLGWRWQQALEHPQLQ